MANTDRIHTWASNSIRSMLARIFAGLAAQHEADARELRDAAKGVL